MSRPEETAPTILLVEDDSEILAMVQMFLAEQGHEVLTAGEGGAALAVLDSGRRIDLLVTDIVMPGPCDGFELARRAVAMQPDLKVLYISGFPERIQQSETLRARGEFLRKPFRLAELGQAIAEMLQAPPVQLNRVLRQVHALWLALRGGEPLPDVAALASGLEPPLEPHVALVDVLAGDPLRFRWASVGDALVEGFGEDPTGALVGEKANGHRSFFVGLFDEVARVGRPLYAASSYLVEGAGTTTERLLLPFAHGAGGVGTILVAQTFDETGQHLGIFTLAPHAVRRRDIVERL